MILVPGTYSTPSLLYKWCSICTVLVPLYDGAKNNNIAYDNPSLYQHIGPTNL